MPYGDFVGPIQYDEPEAAQGAPQPVTADDAPATAAAQGQFGLYTLASGVLGFWFPAAWIATGVFGFIWLIGGTVIAPLEASSKQKARDHGGGGGDILVIFVILAVLAVGAFLVFAGMAGGGA